MSLLLLFFPSQELMKDLEEKEKDLNKLKQKVDNLQKNNHPAFDKIDVSDYGSHDALWCEMPVSERDDSTDKFVLCTKLRWIEEKLVDLRHSVVSKN